ncbi:MAG: glycosyltransferase [Breznakibacter sp.]
MPLLSLIVPVFNRPNEIEELLLSLIQQSVVTDLEVVIVEDGSNRRCDHIITQYKPQLPIQYIFQQNTGPGPARNNGAKHANGTYLVFLDSDVILPTNYIQTVILNLANLSVDCFGGPDKAHESFTPVQKAISYAMTSPLTTGGIRGSKKRMDKFYPRSFNLGIKKTVFDKIEGFSAMRFGEDLDLSMRLIENGYCTGLFADSWVYHKRRTTFKSFYKQVFNSGIARINLEKRHKGTLRLVHLLPAMFVMFNIIAFVSAMFVWQMAVLALLPAFIFLADAFIRTKELRASLLSVPASYTQLLGYGLGFIKAFYVRILMGKDEFHSFAKNFYK